LFEEGGLLYNTTLLLKIPELNEEVVKVPPIATVDTPLPAILKLDLISATGTAILIAVMLTGMLSRNINLKEGFQSLSETIK
ncbi:L-lactate permease, partial [Escherichia coli]|uniref:L-lactate permease n=1 Tax=Escherichia coli TaxID=562 RepID=UPI001966CF2D